MQRKVMIACAVTGSADTPGKNPAVPVTPAQIAQSAIDAAKAGAAIVHIHVRDPQTTKPSPGDWWPRHGLPTPQTALRCHRAAPARHRYRTGCRQKPDGAAV